jgi:hypothetical protein
MGNTMNQSAIGSVVAGVCAILVVFGAEPKAFAQAGSTGGTLGNTDKSISGSRREDQETHSRPKGDDHQNRSRETRTTHAPSAVSVAGRWHWTADCQSGHYSAAFTLSEPSGGQFTGTFDGTNLQIGSISGEVSGERISFTRNAGLVVQHWSGHLTPGHISGSISGNENCTWQASK